MLPGKKFAPDDLARIVRRRIWLIVVPVAVVAAGVALWARSLPDMYWTSTTILVVPQRISESIVRPTITASIADRLPSIREAILSRTGLETLIAEFDLYPDERRVMLMEDVVGIMRDNISTTTIRNDAFEVGYAGRDPVKVMRVTERLGQLFIDQSLSYRHNLAADTDSFLDSQLVETRTKLEQQERRLAAYKQTFAGELPTQVTSNLQQVTSANTQVQASLDVVNRAMERRLTLEKIAADLDAPGAIVATPDMGVLPSGVAGTTLQQLTVAQENLAALQARGLKPGHPDLEAARRQVRDLGQRFDDESRASSATAASAPRPVSAAEASRLSRLSQTRAEIAEIDRQIARAREEERRAREAGQAAQARLDALPSRETELISLTRDYDIVLNTYRSLLAKQEEAQVSANLEQRQVGEQFKVLEPARMPERPFSPDRARWNLFGIIGGLGLGLAFVALLEARDRSFKTDEDVKLVLDLPVLAVVPVMKSDEDRRRERWVRIGTVALCSTVVLACGAVFVYSVMN